MAKKGSEKEPKGIKHGKREEMMESSAAHRKEMIKQCAGKGKKK